MNVFVVFDEKIDVASLLRNSNIKQAKIYLFPLTSNYLIIKSVETAFKKSNEVILIESAKLINHQVELMSKSIHDWSQTLANYKIANKSLKEWFLFPDGYGSAWWLGLISEKNTVQDPVFFKIAQCNAIYAYLQNHATETNLCAIIIKDNVMRKIVTKTAKRLKLPTVSTKNVTKQKSSFKTKILNYANKNFIFAANLNLFIWLKDSLIARFSLRHFKERFRTKNPFLFITYFPHIDEEASKAGKFINNYACALQNELKTANIATTWLAMPIYYHGHNFRSAVSLAKNFIAHGEHLFLLQEFFTLKVFFKTLRWWAKQVCMSEILLFLLPRQKLVSNLTYRETLPYLNYIWRHSFVGASGIRGIIFYLTFSQIFKTLKSFDTSLHFCEMQAWEKAMLMAKKKFSPHTLSLAFQHTVVMRNYFNYFYSKQDILQTNNKTDLPLPDRLIANGRLPKRLLHESHYPNLQQAEAIRQLYLIKYLQLPKESLATSTSQRKILFIAGSCDKQETKSLLSVVYATFPQALDFEIWCKGSPVNPLPPLFAELSINLADTNYKICNEDVANILPHVNVAFVANTTVAIEAAAFGCELIIPLFADTMLMNPIIETSASYHFVSGPHELESIVKRLMQNKEKQQMNNEIIGECWHIDPALPLWKELLYGTKNRI